IINFIHFGQMFDNNCILTSHSFTPLKHVSKMWTKSFEYKDSYTEHPEGDNPKIDGLIIMYPEPFMRNKRFSISVNNIKYRIQFNNELVFCWYGLNGPKYRSNPKTKLNNHGNQ